MGDKTAPRQGPFCEPWFAKRSSANISPIIGTCLMSKQARKQPGGLPEPRYWVCFRCHAAQRPETLVSTLMWPDEG